MPSERVSMYRIREVLRLSAAGLTVRQVAAGTRLSVGAVWKYLRASRGPGADLSESAILRTLLSHRVRGCGKVARRAPGITRDRGR
jgi:hypothetical protein